MSSMFKSNHISEANRFGLSPYEAAKTLGVPSVAAPFTRSDALSAILSERGATGGLK
jgi:hypothetical protein